MPKEWFSIRDIEKLTGLSPSMTDYLCRTKIIAPSNMGSKGRGRGKVRRFSFGDVVQLRTYAKLLKQGVSVKRLKEAHKTWSLHFKVLEIQTPPSEYLLTDGVRIYFRHPNKVLEELSTEGQLAFSFIIDLKQIHHEIVSEIKKLSA